MSRTKYPVPLVTRFLLGLLLAVYAVLMFAGIAVTINFDTLFPLSYSVLSVWGGWMTVDHYIWGRRPKVQLVGRTSALDVATGSASVATFRSHKKKLKWSSAPLIVLLPLALAASFTVCCLPIGFFIQLV